MAAIVGPTASGKSELAMALAARLDLEILVADSRQVYRGMDIGTAKPSPADRAVTPHHLLDLVNPDQPFSVADWLRAARAAIHEVAGRGRLPLLVGGTGLYVTSLLEGHDYELQAWSPAKRAVLSAELASRGLEPLAARLITIAPEVAARIDLRNPRRVVRALERAELAGTVGEGRRPYGGPVTMVGLSRPREVLYRRIDQRTRALFAIGLLDEVQGLIAAGYGPDLGPMSGHGYREAARHLAGEWSLGQAIEVTARRTRQYAKRQLSWFRRDPRIVWLDVGERRADDHAIVERGMSAIGPRHRG